MTYLSVEEPVRQKTSALFSMDFHSGRNEALLRVKGNQSVILLFRLCVFFYRPERKTCRTENTGNVFYLYLRPIYLCTRIYEEIVCILLPVAGFALFLPAEERRI